MGVVGRRPWEMSGLRPSDMATAFLYDHFTPFVLMQLEELGSCSAEDEQGYLGRPVHEVLEELEQRRVRPVQVFDDEYERALGRDGLEERAPGREGLLALRGDVAFGRADETRELAFDPRTL